MNAAPSRGVRHVAALRDALPVLLANQQRLEDWGCRLYHVFVSGGRLLVAGNGGSAAQAQHLTSELVGRYLEERPPYSAIALTAETSSLTALLNDYGAHEVFARQVLAHGRPGDIFLGLSTSGNSKNVLAAAAAAGERNMVRWAFTGPAPSQLAKLCDDSVAVGAASTATIQEVHLVAVHLLCAAFDACHTPSPSADRLKLVPG